MGNHSLVYYDASGEMQGVAPMFIWCHSLQAVSVDYAWESLGGT